MRDRSYWLWSSGLLLVGCASATPQVADSRAVTGTPVSKQLHWELTSVADELNYEDPCPLVRAAKNTAFDECLTSFDCTYCRKRDGWWMLQRCDAPPAREARVAPPRCDPYARCGA